MDGFKELMRKELLKRSKELVRLIEQEAPPEVVGRQVVLVMENSVGYCGNAGPYTQLQNATYGLLAIRHGFCHICDSEEPRRATTKLGFCDICATRLSQNDV